MAVPIGRCDTVKVVPSASRSRWREISRKANKALYLKRLPEAAAGQKEAIAALSAVSPSSESLLNLKMNLAEVRRQEGLLKDATQLLDAVEAEIKRTPPLDPVLPARFWRSRSRLQESLKLREAAARSEMKAFDIALPHFAINSTHTIDAYTRLVRRLCELNAFDLVMEVMSRADKVYSSTSKQHAKLRTSFQATFAESCKSANEQHDLQFAGDRLTGLCKVYKDLPVLLRSCQTWFDTTRKTGGRVAYNDLAANLELAFQREKPSAENILILIKGRRFVVDLYRQQQHHHEDVVQEQVRRTRDLILAAKTLRVAPAKLGTLYEALKQLQMDIEQNKIFGKGDKTH